MAFLSSAIVWILSSPITQKLISLLWDSIASYFEKMAAKHKQILANQAAARASVQPMINAKTGKEIDDATDSDLNGL